MAETRITHESALEMRRELGAEMEPAVVDKAERAIEARAADRVDRR
jgi:hypothetical protein